MFSVIAILEHFLLLEALKDSKIPYLFLTDLVSIEFHSISIFNRLSQYRISFFSKKMPCYLIFCN